MNLRANCPSSQHLCYSPSFLTFWILRWKLKRKLVNSGQAALCTALPSAIVMQESDQQLSLAVGKQTFYLGGVGSSLASYFEARSTNPCLTSKSRDAVPGRYAEGTATEE